MEGCAKIMYIRVRRGAQTVPLPRLPANCGQFAIIYDLPTRRRPSSSRVDVVPKCKMLTRLRFSLCRTGPSLSPFYVPCDRVDASYALIFPRDVIVRKGARTRVSHVISLPVVAYVYRIHGCSLLLRKYNLAKL